eukprot:1591440-Pleurochrysis_carterae.AAC.1
MQIASSGEAAITASRITWRSEGKADSSRIKRSSMLSSDADVSKSLPERRAFTVATGPLANTPPA